MVASLHKGSKIFLVLGLAALLLLGFFGLSHSGMDMDANGNMLTFNCPLMTGQAAVCNMNPLEHIAAWQSTFTSVLPQNSSTLMLLLLAALLGAAVWTKLRPLPDKALNVMLRVIHTEYSLPPTLLQELFSNGILNPKIF